MRANAVTFLGLDTDHANIAPESEYGAVEVTVEAAAGHLYMIDCSVAEGLGGQFTVEAGWDNPGQSSVDKKTWLGSQQHLTFVLQSVGDSGPKSFQIHDSKGWYFYSCQVTPYIAQ